MLDSVFDNLLDFLFGENIESWNEPRKNSPLPSNSDKNKYEYYPFKLRLAAITKVSYVQLPKELKEQINEIEFKDIKRFIEIELLNQWDNTCEAIKSEKRFLKENYDLLPRTLQIICHNGRPTLLLETKLKQKDGSKLYKKPYRGGFKQGTDCWKIDSFMPEPWVHLTMYANNKGNLSTIQEELDVEKLVKTDLMLKDSPYIEKKITPALRFKNGLYKQDFYAPKAIGSLDSVSENSELSDEDKLQVATGACNALKVFHNSGLVHQDLKPGNYLVYKAGNKYEVKITDYGFTKKVGQYDSIYDYAIHGTRYYISPEIYIAACHQDNQTCRYYIGSEFNLSNQVPLEIKKDFDALLKDDKHKIFNPELLQPHPANDNWALGCVLYQLYSGGKLITSMADLETIKHEGVRDVIKGLLDLNRDTRLTAAQAATRLEALIEKPKVKGKRQLEESLQTEESAPNQAKKLKFA